MAFTPENLAQAINPWSWWLNQSDNTNGFINVTNYKSGNPKLEQKIVGEVAGYGMQLGVVEDTIEMMMAFLPEHKITNAQRKTIEKFKNMVAEIKAAKEKALLEQMSAGGIEKFIDGLEELKKDRPELYARVSARLRQVL